MVLGRSMGVSTGIFPTSSPNCCQERQDIGLNPGRKDQKMLSGYGNGFKASTILPYGLTHSVLEPFLPL